MGWPDKSSADQGLQSKINLRPPSAPFLFLALFVTSALLGLSRPGWADDWAESEHLKQICKRLLENPNFSALLASRRNTYVVDPKQNAIFESHIGFLQASEPVFKYDPDRLQGIPQATMGALLPLFTEDLVQALQDESNLMPYPTPQEDFILVTQGPNNLKENFVVLSADGRTIVNVFAKPLFDNRYKYLVVKFKGYKRLAGADSPDSLPKSIFSAKQTVYTQAVAKPPPAKGFPHNPGDDFVLLASYDEPHEQWRLMNPVQGMTLAFIKGPRPTRLLRQALATYLATPIPADTLIEYWQVPYDPAHPQQQGIIQLASHNGIYLGLVLPPTKNSPQIDVMHFAKIENFDLSGNNAIDNLENYIGQSILPRVLEFLALYEKHKKIITIEAEPTNVQIKNALLEAASAKLPATDKDLAEKGQDKNKLRDDDLIGTSLKGDDDGVYVLPDEDDE